MEIRDPIEKAALIVAFIAIATVVVRVASEPQWKEFTSREDGFSVLFPGKPKIEKQSLVVSGIKLEVHSLSAWSRTNAQFTFSYADAPAAPTAEATEGMLDAQRKALVRGDESRILSAEKLTINGFPVRRYKAIVEGGSEADEKLYAVKRRLYILLVVHDRERDRQDVEKFFGSFKFEPKE